MQRPEAPTPTGWLHRIPPGWFALPLGFLGLAGAWRRLGQNGFDPAIATSQGLLKTGLALLALLGTLYLVKALRFPARVKQEFLHPVQGSLLALLPVSVLLSVALLAPTLPDAHPMLLAITLVALLLQGSIAWHKVALLSTGRIPADLVTPALYVPPVPGGFVGAMALHTLGYHGFATLLMGMGVGAWALLEARVLHRLFAGPLPLPLRATLGLEMAPSTVGSLALSSLWPDLPADVLLVALGIASGPVLAILTRWHWWSQTPFTTGFWSFSFPLAAFASATVETVRRGHWPFEVAAVAVAVSTLVIAYLLIRTAMLAVRGQLLPQH